MGKEHEKAGQYSGRGAWGDRKNVYAPWKENYMNEQNGWSEKESEIVARVAGGVLVPLCTLKN
ncbi:MAG: hypothetical protein PHS82_14660 [Lachnospiraceae bacterium]|nr:hypothetical protein [Lachnospiraceae bacterium]